MNHYSLVSCPPTCTATSATVWLSASSTTIASNRSVNPLPGLAHGTGTARTPCAEHARVDERLVLEEIQMPPHTLTHVMRRARLLGAVEPRARPEADRDVRLASAVRPVAEFHPRTIHGSGNCKAEVNGEAVSISPNYLNVLTSNHPSPTLNSERSSESIISLSFSTEEKATVYLVNPSFS